MQMNSIVRCSYREEVEKYYSCFLGSNENIFDRHSSKVYSFYSPVRNVALPGYGQCFDLVVIKSEKATVISYGDIAREKIPHLVNLLQADNNNLYEALYKTFGIEPRHSLKYFFGGKAPETKNAHILNHSDYSAFETFYRSNNPEEQDISWLHEYFDEMVSKQTCCGVFVDYQLVSCTDSPTVPCMSDLICEIGINTLKEYRNRGFAKDACSCAIHEILRQGKIPIWSTSVKNIPSQKLAKSLGFRIWGESFSVSIQQK